MTNDHTLPITATYQGAPLTDRLLTRPEAAAVLGVAPHTLANWASAGRGPRMCRVGARAARYRLSDLTAYMEGLETTEPVSA